MRHTTYSLALLCALGALACSKQEVACPSIYIAPHASIEFSEPLRENGTFTVDLTVDGEPESCPMIITGMGPSEESVDGATMASPSTRVEMTCEKIGISGYKNDGSIPGFKLSGTPKAVSIRLVQDGRVRADQSFDLNYAPASLIGEGCSKTEHASATLAIEPLASSPELAKPAANDPAPDPDGAAPSVR